MGETVIQNAENAEKPKEGGGSDVGSKVKKPFDGGGTKEEGKGVTGQTLKNTDEKLGDANITGN